MSAIPSDRYFSEAVGQSLSSARPAPPSFEPEQIEPLLSAFAQRLSESSSAESVHSTMEDLFLWLEQLRDRVDAERWNEFVLTCRRHALRELVHQDPFTYRAYHKPRGYAGDAVMMDYIYGREELWSPPETTELGGHIFDFTTSAPASAGVRARRGYIANALDQAADEYHYPHVLSVASGHCREAMMTAAVRRRKFGRFVALDADSRSLEEVQRSLGPFGVETLQLRIARLLAARTDIGTYDVIYSLGLYDYLEEPLARGLTSRLFSMLRPGGRLILANFLPNIRDIGYMEAYMDWRLVYRTRHDMIDMTVEIPQPLLQEVKLHAEENQNIIFLEITKA